MKVVHLAISLCLASFLVACGPSEQERAAIAERKRIECLDKICPGDVEPKRDSATEEILKLNGRWFIGPKAYFSSGRNGAAFYWPSKTPAMPGEIDFPERARVVTGHGDEVTIEIFLRSHPDPVRGESWYEMLKRAESEGRLISKSSPRAGLEVWRIRKDDGLPPTVWYAASELKGTDGYPPVLACDEQDPKFDGCTTGFMWQPDIAADLRFRAKHGPDWPEIYQETIRVLSLLRETAP